MSKGIILYIGGFELPDKNAAAQRAIAISKSIISLGYELILLGTSKELLSNDDISEINSNMKDLRMLQKSYPINSSQWINHVTSCEKEIALIKKNPSIQTVICYNYPAIALWRLKKYCNKNKIKLIADVTEWYESGTRGLIHNLIKNIDTNLRMRYIHSKLNNIICISRYLYNYYKDVVPNCILIPGTIDKKDEKWKKIKEYVPNPILTFGYAGNPGEKCEKERIDLLIKAICELNEQGLTCSLKLAGFNQEQFEMRYPELVNKIHYKDCIFYLGKLSHQKCLQLISSVDFSVIIRDDKRVTRAGFPTKLSESFACGTPVLSTPSGNLAEFIIDGENGLLTNDFSYQSLVDTIKRAALYQPLELISMHNFVRNNNFLQYQNFTKVIAEGFTL